MLLSMTLLKKMNTFAIPQFLQKRVWRFSAPWLTGKGCLQVSPEEAPDLSQLSLHFWAKTKWMDITKDITKIKEITKITQLSKFYEYDTFRHWKNSMTLCVTASMTLYIMQNFVWHFTSLREYDTICMTQKVRPSMYPSGCWSTEFTCLVSKSYRERKKIRAQRREINFHSCSPNVKCTLETQMKPHQSHNKKQPTVIRNLSLSK